MNSQMSRLFMGFIAVTQVLILAGCATNDELRAMTPKQRCEYDVNSDHAICSLGCFGKPNECRNNCNAQKFNHLAVCQKIN